MGIAVVGVVLAIVSILLPVPVVLPVIGASLGANAIMKEMQNEVKKKSIMITGANAVVLNGITIILFFISR